jgi:4-hydroxy-2-oxoheptanedioate aldolase
MKASLARGEAALGVSVMIPSPQVVEMLARLGFDWVLLDCEHGTFSPESLEIMTMAADGAGITAVGRPRDASAGAIQEVLERGVLGVQVPHVNSAAEARAVVDAVKYHPLGRRGLAARTRPAGYGIGVSLDDYARRANAETLICVQLEGVEALDRVEEITAVDGIDVFFVGPADLSQALGHPGQTDHPDVRAAMAKAFAAIQGRGKVAGTAGNAESWREHRERGVAYLYTHLPALLAAGSRAYLDRGSADEPRGSKPPKGKQYHA